MSAAGDVDECPTCAGRGVLPKERECASETCSVRFRWQDGKAKGSWSNAKYCSRACARAQAQRQLRRRQRGAK